MCVLGVVVYKAWYVSQSLCRGLDAYICSDFSFLNLVLHRTSDVYSIFRTCSPETARLPVFFAGAFHVLPLVSDVPAGTIAAILIFISIKHLPPLYGLWLLRLLVRGLYAASVRVVLSLMDEPHKMPLSSIPL